MDPDDYADIQQEIFDHNQAMHDENIDEYYDEA